MGLPIVENLSGLQDSIFRLSRSPQHHFSKKQNKTCRIILLYRFFPLPPVWGLSPCLGPWAAVIYLLRTPSRRETFTETTEQKKAWREEIEAREGKEEDDVSHVSL